MSENKKLIYWLTAIFGCTFLLIFGVVAYDRQLAIVDHLFDFHINEHAVREELSRMSEEKQQKEARTREWVNDIRCWGRDDSSDKDRGTIGPPDRDK